MLTLLTPTGCRPEAWALCERWMLRQTYAGPVRWVIVDDGSIAHPITFEREGWTLDIVRPAPFWRLRDNTQARNLAAGLAVIDAGARVVVIEDDDWYAPDWLQQVDAELDRVPLVGEKRARYYNVAMRVAHEHRNERNASLSATACRDEGLMALRRAVAQRERFIDLTLWRDPKPQRSTFSGHRVVGIKGLPGRSGIGVGHNADLRGTVDAPGNILRAWVGADAEAYQPFAGRRHGA